MGRKDIIMNKGISVIIRTRNEERYIGHAIQSVLDHIHKPEILIIDNGSNDETAQIIRMFLQDKRLKDNNSKNYTDIKIFSINKYTPGKSLNFAIKKAKNENIMIMSAHCVLNKINLEKHIKDLEKNISIFGNQIPIYYGKKITKRYIWSHFESKPKINMFSKLEDRYFLHNAIAIYKRKFMLKNPFNENLQGKEDRYWINDLMKSKKYNYRYDPQLEIFHNYTSNGNTWKGIG